MKKPALLFAAAITAMPGCFTSETPEISEGQRQPQISDVPEQPEHLCEIVRHSVRQRALTGLAAGGLAPPGFRASFEANQAATDCYEEERMRTDCDHVRDEVRRVMDAIGRSIEIHTHGSSFIGIRAGRNAEEACLAGYGLAPEEEEAQYTVSRTLMISL